MSPRHILPLAVTALTAAFPAPALARDVLPDLDQEQPGGLEVTADASGAIPRFHLGFNSAVDNVGRGRLIIDAHRASTAEPEMVADQRIAQRGGGTRTVAGVGRLQYAYSADHEHWHYLGFEHYELRRASDYALIAPDQKTGFCLGDRYNTNPDKLLPGEPQPGFYTGYCGLHQTELLTLTEGISVGYGDIYYASLEGQFVDVTGVASDQYYLVHRVNTDRTIRESDYSNNASALLVSLSWPRGTGSAPSVKVLRACPQDDACPGRAQQPRSLTRAAAVRYARTGLRRALGLAPRGLAVGCSRRLSRVAVGCHASGTLSGRRYLASEIVAYQRTKRGVLYLRYGVSAKVIDQACAAARRGGCAHKLSRRRGRVRLATVAARESAVAEPRQRLVALDHSPLDGVRFRPVVHEVPGLVRHPLGRLRGGVAAQ